MVALMRLESMVWEGRKGNEGEGRRSGWGRMRIGGRDRCWKLHSPLIKGFLLERHAMEFKGW